MDHTVDFDVPAETVHHILTSRGYWDGLTDAYRELTPHTEVIEFSSDDAGTDLVFKHFVARADFPAVVRTVLPVDMVISRAQHFEPYDAGAHRATGNFRATVPAMPGHFSGRYFLSQNAAGDRSKLKIACEAKVGIPLVGGTIEKIILDGAPALFDAERNFISDWIATHH